MKLLGQVIKFDKRKSIIGVILAAVVMVVCCLWFEWQQGIKFAAAFLVAGCVKIDTEKTWCQYLLNFIGGLLVALAVWYMCMAALDVVDDMAIYWTKPLLNMVCIFIVFGFVFLITASWKISVIIASLLLVVLSTVNGFIFQFRGKELSPMDFLSIKTAMSVAGQYKPEVIPSMAYGWIIWALSAFTLFSFPKFPKVLRMGVRQVTLIVESIFILILWVGAEGLIIRTWDKQGTQFNGYYLNFFLGIRDAKAEKPENYGPEVVETYAQEYIEVNNTEEKKSLPNVIVIMNESYADFRVLGQELRTNQPVTPFMDSVTENAVRGYALSSVYAGNTANSEFEFLTGHSLAYLPEGSIPYQQYINSNIGTLAWLLDSYGYKSVSTHPYFANGWSRKRIYPYLGFEESTFIDSYPMENMVRSYISDQETYEYIINELNNKKEGEPLFMFGVTVQNHGGYGYEGKNYTKAIELEGYSQEYPLTEQYLSLIHESDKAMEYLLTYLEDYPEDTVVLFFGDHYPDLETMFYDEVHGGGFNTLSEKMLKYKIPFMVWANYDIPEQTVECTSINYLSRYLLEAAGLELSPYHSFLADLEKVIPAMNSMGYYSVDRNDFITYDQATGNEAEWLGQYANLQYNNLFDSKNRNEVFFGKYISSESKK